MIFLVKGRPNAMVWAHRDVCCLYARAYMLDAFRGEANEIEHLSLAHTGRLCDPKCVMFPSLFVSKGLHVGQIDAYTGDLV